MCRWNTEAFSFLSTSYADGEYVLPTQAGWNLPHELVPVGDDPPTDGYALYPIELPWWKKDTAYENAETGVKITHFPVVHDRKGSMGYKLEWNDITMVYTSDTKPELYTIVEGSNGGRGVDVLIHEMAVPPDVWTMRAMGLDRPGSGPVWEAQLAAVKSIYDNSHSPQGAFGYLLSQISPRPRLTVATHFMVGDDTVACALRSVNQHCPDVGTDHTRLGDYGLVFSMDRMVIRVFAGNPKPAIVPCKAKVLTFGYPPAAQLKSTNLKTPKYHDRDGNGDPYAQLDMSTVILPGPDTFCDNGY
jgi:ribonuclease Z